MQDKHIYLVEQVMQGDMQLVQLKVILSAYLPKAQELELTQVEFDRNMEEFVCWQLVQFEGIKEQTEHGKLHDTH